MHGPAAVRGPLPIMRTLVILLATLAGASAAAAETPEMWNCAVGGSPGSAIVLVGPGPRSYVKIGGQRVPATVSHTTTTRRWTWGANAIDVDGDGLARYYEGGNYDTPKGTFRCRQMG